MAKGRANGKFKTGGHSGWKEYRYGDSNARPITLASQKPKQIFRGKDRDHVVNEALNVMRDWRSTPFEYEGPVRAGLRSALCMKGHGWAISDHEAGEIVREGLRRIGATRPTWDQGQRYYSDPRENCRWCYAPIAPEDMSGGRSRLFCSDHCRRAAYVAWDMKNAATGDAMAREAYRAIYREKVPTRECEQCRNAFTPQRERADTRFCSLRCFSESRRLLIPECACQNCGTMFRPSSSNLEAKFCGKKCADAAKRIYQPRSCQMCSTHFIPTRESNYFCSSACARRGRGFRKVEAVCQWCCEAFLATRADATYCSTGCARFAFRVKIGRIKRITPPVFDFLFQIAA